MKVWRWLERAIFVVGLLGVGVWLGSIAESALFQAWQNWVFERQLSGRPADFDEFLGEGKQLLGEGKQRLVEVIVPPAQRRTTPPPAQDAPPVTRTVPDRSLIGRLRIPRLQVSSMVREGIGESTLRVALGHIPGTALPGSPGNVGLAGHRDTLFRPLRQIRRDDLIRLETLGGTYTYRVERTEIVWPKNVSVLRVGRQPELTLVTCYPFYYVGAAPKRFVVRAREISASVRPVPKSQEYGSRRSDQRPPPRKPLFGRGDAVHRT